MCSTRSASGADSTSAIRSPSAAPGVGSETEIPRPASNRPKAWAAVSGGSGERGEAGGFNRPPSADSAVIGATTPIARKSFFQNGCWAGGANNEAS